MSTTSPANRRGLLIFHHDAGFTNFESNYDFMITIITMVAKQKTEVEIVMRNISRTPSVLQTLLRQELIRDGDKPQIICHLRMGVCR